MNSYDNVGTTRLSEMLTQRLVLDDDIVVRELVLTRRAVVLVGDASGSMRGERVHVVAATAGARAGELHRDALGVVAFWSDAAVLLRLGEPVRPMKLLDMLLQIPARGLSRLGHGTLRILGHGHHRDAGPALSEVFRR